MVSLTAAQVKELAKEYGVVPVVQEVYSDTCTPISLLKKIRGQSSRCFLLENVEGGEQWGRYSFLGLNPILRVTCKNHVVTVQRGSLVTTQTSTVPFEILRKLQQQYNSPVLPNLPPFTGGFVGYFGYSMIGYAEPTLQLQSGEWNDFDLMLFDKVIAFDHLRQKIQLIYNVRTDNAEENYTKAVEELNQMALLIAAPPSPSEPNKTKRTGYLYQ